MIAKYSINENFFIVKPRPSHSWVWKCILKNREQFRKGIRWKVGDGKSINFWLDNWWANDSFATLKGIRDTSSIDTSLRVSHVISANNEWDITKLQGLVNDSWIQLIYVTPLPFNPLSDSICWVLSGSGEFSTKSATWIAHGLDFHKSPEWEFSWIWKLDIMPKFQVFLWQLCHASLLTRGNLLYRGMKINPLCLHWNEAIEDEKHLFIGCHDAQQVWQLASDHHWVTARLPNISQMKIQHWLLNIK